MKASNSSLLYLTALVFQNRGLPVLPGPLHGGLPYYIPWVDIIQQIVRVFQSSLFCLLLTYLTHPKQLHCNNTLVRKNFFFKCFSQDILLFLLLRFLALPKKTYIFLKQFELLHNISSSRQCSISPPPKQWQEDKNKRWVKQVFHLL